MPFSARALRTLAAQTDMSLRSAAHAGFPSTSARSHSTSITTRKGRQYRLIGKEVTAMHYGELAPMGRKAAGIPSCAAISLLIDWLVFIS